MKTYITISPTFLTKSALKYEKKYIKVSDSAL